MQTIEKKAMQILEYPKVLEQLSDYALSDHAKRALTELKPAFEVREIERRQAETADGLKILTSEGGMPLVNFSDLKPLLKRLSIGGTLDGTELVGVMRVMSLTADVIQFFEELTEKEFELQELYEWIDHLVPMKTVRQKMERSISEGGHVKDQASVKLARIRSSIAQAERNIRRQLDQVMRGRQAKYLSDTLITMRNNRYVLPVQAHYRNKFGGIVHDQSASGQTLFIEPQRVVDLNNQLKQLQSEERHEELQVLESLSDQLRPLQAELATNCRFLTKLDVVQAKAGYARELEAVRPQLDVNEHVALYEARHPLIPAEEIVANDILLGGDYRQVVVTGPNTGGKTVILKTLGLLQLMAQAGLHLPVAAGSSVGVYDHILADIGDEQSIEQNLSTFSSHMTTIVDIMAIADETSLVLFDELGAGTDPQEGSALAMSILDTLMERGTQVMVTSHYPELKAYGYNRPETLNASMEFDVETLQPTYRFLMGIPGKSNAFEIAARLGLSPDVIARAKGELGSDVHSIDEMITDLNERKREIAEEQAETYDYLLEAEKMHRELSQIHGQYLETEKERKRQARTEANEIVKKAERQAARIIEDLKQMQADLETKQVKEHELIDVQTELSRLKQEESHLEQNKVYQRARRDQTLKVGDTVHVQSLDQSGVLIEKISSKRWMVQMGMMKAQMDEDNLTKIKSEPEVKSSSTHVRTASANISSELDLRGQRVDEAVMNLSRYVDQALLAHLEQVTIIHGMGTGAVRQAVKKYLKKHPQVTSCDDAPANMGGNGATIVKFK